MRKSERQKPQSSEMPNRRPPTSASPHSALRTLEIVGARHNNLKNINVAIPLGTLTAVTGVSGSGKSSLVEDILYNQLARTLHRASTRARRARRDPRRRADQQGDPRRSAAAGQHADVEPGHVHRRVRADSRSCSRSCPSRSSAATRPRRFSFNVPGGRCEACEGNGQRASRCTFCPTCGSSATRAAASATTPRRSTCTFHGQLDRRRARHVVRRGGRSCSRTSPRFAASCRRCATSGSTT